MKITCQLRAALNNIASKRLSELQTSSAGAPVSVPITQGYYFNAGDFINLYQPKYMLKRLLSNDAGNKKEN